MNRALLTGIAVFGLTISAASAQSVVRHKGGGEQAFVAKFKACMVRHAVSNPATVECYLTPTLTYWCPRAVPQSIPDGCTAEANASSRPARRAGY